MGAGWASAVFCARCSMVASIGLVGRLARTPSLRWRPRARSPLPLCSCALPRVLVSPQGRGNRQGATTTPQFLQVIDPLVHGTRATTAQPRLHHHTCMYALIHALTAHQPICASQTALQWIAMAAQMDLNMLVLVHAALHPATWGRATVAGGPAQAGALLRGRIVSQIASLRLSCA